MKFTNVDIRIENGGLVIDGKPTSDLFEKADREPIIRMVREVTAALPTEDVTPGHVFPSVIPTTSRAS
jgi:hypothetical protein